MNSQFSNRIIRTYKEEAKIQLSANPFARAFIYFITFNPYGKITRQILYGASLIAQWLTVHLPMQEARV